MTDTGIVESYAYATDDLEVATVELRHPMITSDDGQAGVIRIAAVSATPSELEAEPYFEARLEATAPLNAGEIVKFIRAPIVIERPERSTTGVPQAVMRVANVDTRIADGLKAVARSTDPVECTIRSFTDRTRLNGDPDVLGGLEMVSPEIDAVEVSVRAQGPDVVNTPFHVQRYDSRFPLLGL